MGAGFLALGFALGGSGTAGVPSTRTALPPAASISSTARFENACAVTVRLVVSSPFPRILIGCLRLRTTPAERSSSGVTSTPASKRSSDATLTGVVCVRNGPMGIDFLWFGPRSLPRRM